MLDLIFEKSKSSIEGYGSTGLGWSRVDTTSSLIAWWRDNARAMCRDEAPWVDCGGFRKVQTNVLGVVT